MSLELSRSNTRTLKYLGCPLFTTKQTFLCKFVTDVTVTRQPSKGQNIRNTQMMNEPTYIEIPLNVQS